MNVVTLKKHRYRDELKHVGDKYEINSKSVIVLYRALGWVTEVPPELKPIQGGTLSVANVFPTYSQTGLANKPKTAKGKGKYQRKDLRADK